MLSFLGEAARFFMSFIITGTDLAGAVSLKRDSAAAAIKKAVELMGDDAETSASRALMAASTFMRNSTNSVRVRGRDASLRSPSPRARSPST